MAGIAGRKQGEMGSSAAVLPAAYHQGMAAAKARPGAAPAGTDATALKKRPKMDHSSKGSKRSKLNVKESSSNAVPSLKDAVPASSNQVFQRRGMFLAFIDNALQQRRMVCDVQLSRCYFPSC